MKRVIFFLVFLVYSFALFFLSYYSKQDEFFPLFTCFTLAFGGLLYFYLSYDVLKYKNWLWLILFVNLIPFLATPSLSPDVYRFIWDGDIMLQGINPFSYAPIDLIQIDSFQWANRLQEVYDSGITDLSKKHFSVYPTVNQLYFYISSSITNDIDSFFIVLRILMLLTHVLGFVFIIRILDLLSIARAKVLLVALNPLVIIECIGNFHFEGIMLSFLVVAFYFLIKKQWLKSAFFWAIAVNVKLTPLLLLPVTWKYLKFKWSLVYYGLTILFSGVILLIVVWPNLIHHFWQSVQLYFNNFEFNSSVFKVLSLLFSDQLAGNAIPIIGPILSMVSLAVILILALINPTSKAKGMFRFMLYAYVVYLLLATTVHPWYVIVPLVISLFTRYYFVVFWSYIVTVSYVFYDESINHNYLMLLGYFVVFLIASFEFLKYIKIKVS
jgi:hypothetical protein